MEKIIEYLRDFNLITVFIRLFLAMVFGAVIGLERGKQGRAAGMRTHILVCLGACLATMIGFYVSYNVAKELGTTGDPLRVAAQVISGIGFLGVGTILIKGRFQITGLTTAAGLWCAAAIGLALGAGFYEGAIITFVLAVLTVTIVHKLEYTLNKRHRRFGIYVEIRSDEFVRKAIGLLEELYKVTDIQVTAPRSGISGNVGIEANVHNHDLSTTPDEISKKLEEFDFIVYALESI